MYHFLKGIVIIWKLFSLILLMNKSSVFLQIFQESFVKFNYPKLKSKFLQFLRPIYLRKFLNIVMKIHYKFIIFYNILFYQYVSVFTANLLKFTDFSEKFIIFVIQINFKKIQCIKLGVIFMKFVKCQFFLKF